MHASDVVEMLPALRPDDDVLSAVRMVSRNGLPELVVTANRILDLLVTATEEGP